MQSSYPNYRVAVQGQMSLNENSTSSDGQARIMASYRMPQHVAPTNIGTALVKTGPLLNNHPAFAQNPSSTPVFQSPNLPQNSVVGRPLPAAAAVVGQSASMTALLEKLPALIASTAARQPVYAQPLAKNVYRPILTVGTPLVDQNQSYGRVYSSTNNSSSSVQPPSSSLNNQPSSVAISNQPANVVDGFRVPLNKYPVVEAPTYQRHVQSYKVQCPPEITSRPSSTVSSNFAAKAFGVELAIDDETDDDRTVDTPLPSRDTLASAIASPASSFLDAKLLSQVSDAVARVEAHKAAARRQYQLSSNHQPLPNATASEIKPSLGISEQRYQQSQEKQQQQDRQQQFIQQAQQQETDPSQVKEKFYELLRKYQKVKENRKHHIVPESHSSIEHDDKPTNSSEETTVRRPALMGSRPRPSLLGSGDSWQAQEPPDSRRSTVDEPFRNENYGREYGKAQNKDQKVETRFIEPKHVKYIDISNPMIVVNENTNLKATPRKVTEEEIQRNREIENFPCLSFGGLPVSRIDELDLADVASQFTLNTHLNNCLPRKSVSRMETSEEDRKKCNEKHCKVFSQLKNLIALDQCYETCIWDYDPRFIMDYLPGTKRGVTGRYDFVHGESYLDDENKWRKYSHLLDSMMKQKVSAQMSSDKSGSVFTKSDIIFAPYDSPQIKSYKMKMILQNKLDIPSRMITEDFCEICNLAFTNIMSSMHHYDSAKHGNNLLSYGKSTAVEIILNIYPEFHLKHFNADWFVNCVRSVLKKCKQKPDQWMCDLCMIPLSGESHAKQHFLGTAHKKRAQDGITFNERMSRVAAAMRATEAASQLDREEEERSLKTDNTTKYTKDYNDVGEPYYDDQEDYNEGHWGDDTEYDDDNRYYEEEEYYGNEDFIPYGESNEAESNFKSWQKTGYQATFTTPRVNKRGYDGAFR